MCSQVLQRTFKQNALVARWFAKRICFFSCVGPDVQLIREFSAWKYFISYTCRILNIRYHWIPSDSLQTGSINICRQDALPPGWPRLVRRRVPLFFHPSSAHPASPPSTTRSFSVFFELLRARLEVNLQQNFKRRTLSLSKTDQKERSRATRRSSDLWNTFFFDVSRSTCRMEDGLAFWRFIVGKWCPCCVGIIVMFLLSIFKAPSWYLLPEDSRGFG